MKKISSLLIVLLLCLSIVIATVVAAVGNYPAVYNLTLTNADTEYSQTLSGGIRKFTVQCRTNNNIRYAFASGYVATPTAPYGTIKAGSVYWEDGLKTTGNRILYFASSTAAVVVEITVWR